MRERDHGIRSHPSTARAAAGARGRPPAGPRVRARCRDMLVGWDVGVGPCLLGFSKPSVGPGNTFRSRSLPSGRCIRGVVLSMSMARAGIGGGDPVPWFLAARRQWRPARRRGEPRGLRSRRGGRRARHRRGPRGSTECRRRVGARATRPPGAAAGRRPDRRLPGRAGHLYREAHPGSARRCSSGSGCLRRKNSIVRKALTLMRNPLQFRRKWMYAPWQIGLQHH